jgi:acetyltransferase-like isoleucine patch superfamily enzyme
MGSNVYVNSNSTWLDTCLITVGSRTLIGPNCSFYSATHPTDPAVRNGTKGPEGGKPIVIGEDCWFGGNCVVLPGVTIGNGVTVGAGSVVTKDVPDYVVVVGNPAGVIRKLERAA